VFLGASRDYLVETRDGTTLRVDTAPDNLVPEGTEVWLALPPERCRALER
jgi:iron(III) transport system ATP-binding protein